MKKRGHKVSIVAGRPYYPLGQVPREYQKRLLKREGEDVRVWIPALETKGLWRRIVIYGAFMLTYPLGILRLWKRFDVVYYISPYPLMGFSWPAIWFGRLTGAKVLLDQHDLWPEIITEVGGIKKGESILKLTTKVSVWGAYAIMTTFDSLKKRMIEFGVPEWKIAMAPLCVDTDYFAPGPDEERKRRIQVAYIGTLAKRYDFESLEEAASRMLDIDFYVSGEGEMGDEITQMKHLRLERGFAPRDTMLSRLRNADILICITKESVETKTTIATKVLEYMAVGKPVIATRNPDMDSLPITEVDFGDVEGIMQSIRTMHRESSRDYCVKHYSLDTLGKAIEEIVA